VRQGFLKRIAKLDASELAIEPNPSPNLSKARWFRFGVKAALFIVNWWFVVLPLLIVAPLAGFRALRGRVGNAVSQQGSV
jgi:hypothetical protein